MPETWTISTRAAFLNELSAFEAKEVAQILKKVNLLTDDPTPDAHTKKQLKHLDGKLHRLRSGNFRVFYTFRESVVAYTSAAAAALFTLPTGTTTVCAVGRIGLRPRKATSIANRR